MSLCKKSLSQNLPRCIKVQIEVFRACSISRLFSGAPAYGQLGVFTPALHSMITRSALLMLVWAQMPVLCAAIRTASRSWFSSSVWALGIKPGSSRLVAHPSTTGQPHSLTALSANRSLNPSQRATQSLNYSLRRGAVEAEDRGVLRPSRPDWATD